jgi:phytoene synthase
MIQLRLSWWRDRLSEPFEAWPKGEPVLAALRAWSGETDALRGLVDGWEARVVGEDGGADLARAEVEAYVALARMAGMKDLDIVRAEASALVDPSAPEQSVRRLPKAMRPLSILRVVAMRERQAGAASPLSDFATIVRVGLFGR